VILKVHKKTKNPLWRKRSLKKIDSLEKQFGKHKDYTNLSLGLKIPT